MFLEKIKFRAYDRAAIKFRGVEADINFRIEDYQEDMKQVKSAREEFYRKAKIDKIEGREICRGHISLLLLYLDCFPPYL